MTNFNTESANNYREMLQDLKSRGLKNILLFVSDELTGLSEALTDEFTLSKHQSCLTHIMRNISNKVRAKDKAEVLQDLKQVYNKETIDEALDALNTFFDKWGKKYPKVQQSLQGKDNLFTFMLFPN
ncbi:DUF1722 domain-containing protein [Parvimonas sp. S3374]|uniref:Mutator family transposase n=1 Tax=Parvimonas parva TaxID=2769485 RepID=A0ABS1C8T6_9FIRM|nr:DUF1722 domain-containing protein [Parvimonas parva]